MWAWMQVQKTASRKLIDHCSEISGLGSWIVSRLYQRRFESYVTVFLFKVYILGVRGAFSLGSRISPSNLSWVLAASFLGLVGRTEPAFFELCLITKTRLTKIYWQGLVGVPTWKVQTRKMILWIPTELLIQALAVANLVPPLVAKYTCKCS